MSLFVADAGPLIALARVKQLSLLKKLFRVVVIPEKVYSELEVNSNRPGAQYLSLALNEGWLHTTKINSPPSASISKSVDEGEAEAIALAMSHSSDRPLLLIDDRKGRLVAKHHKIKIIGTAGVLVLAHQKGLLKENKPVLEQLLINGYRLSTPLCKQVLKLTGET